MKHLYLLRHAKSSWEVPGTADKERALNARGVNACGLLADHFCAAAIMPARIWCSTARRTRETLDRILVRASWPTTLPIAFADDLYLAPPTVILEHIRRTEASAACVLVVGHNPGIEELARMLASDDPGGHRAALDRKYPTGGLASFSHRSEHWQDVGEESCTLRCFVTPRDLEERARR